MTSHQEQPELPVGSYRQQDASISQHALDLCKKAAQFTRLHVLYQMNGEDNVTGPVVEWKSSGVRQGLSRQTYQAGEQVPTLGVH